MAAILRAVSCERGKDKVNFPGEKHQVGGREELKTALQVNGLRGKKGNHMNLPVAFLLSLTTWNMSERTSDIAE